MNLIVVGQWIWTLLIFTVVSTSTAATTSGTTTAIRREISQWNHNTAEGETHSALGLRELAQEEDHDHDHDQDQDQDHNLQPRIVGGDDTSETRYPYFVALQKRGGGLSCGGSLIASDVVLTAAHCYSVDLDTALIGKYTYSEQQNSNGRDIWDIRKIERAYIHPQFNYDDKVFDQMLLKLSSSTTDDYPPVQVNWDPAIPSQTQTNSATVTVIGLGATDNRFGTPDVLQELDTDYIPNDICRQIRTDDIEFTTFLSDDHLCLFASRASPCYGDSGGPQIIRGATPADDIQVGIVSWGIECADPVFPGVGSRTSASTWIAEQACEVAVDPPPGLCSGNSAGDEVNLNIPPPPQLTSAPTYLPSPPPPPPTSSPTRDCAGMFRWCQSDMDCCRSRCTNNVCRNLPSIQRVRLGDDRGGAAGRMRRQGGG